MIQSCAYMPWCRGGVVMRLAAKGLPYSQKTARIPLRDRFPILAWAVKEQLIQYVFERFLYIKYRGLEGTIKRLDQCIISSSSDIR